MPSLNRFIYLDNSASTRVDPEVVTAMLPYFTDFYGNPAALYDFAILAEKGIKTARENIEQSIQARPDTVIFTSGATEANNLAVFSGTRKNSGVLFSAIEHPSVLNCAAKLKAEGISVKLIPVNSAGLIDLTALLDLLRNDDNISLVAIMLVNNEIGTIQPVAEAIPLIRAAVPLSKILVDAVAAYTRLEIDVLALDVDFLALSAHKIHGPKGVGALYVKNRAAFKPMFFGGDQEFTNRPGTENVPAIVGFGKAVELNHREIGTKNQAMARLRDQLLHRIGQEISGTTLNGSPCQRVSNNINISIAGVSSEPLLHLLEKQGIYASSGSACHSKTGGLSPVISALGKNEKDGGVIRFSLSKYTTTEDIEQTVTALKTAVKDLRRYSPF